MTKKKLKKNEIDPAELKAQEFVKKSWKFIKKESIRLTKFVFFYQPKDKFMAITHIIDIVAILYIASRILRS